MSLVFRGDRYCDRYCDRCCKVREGRGGYADLPPLHCNTAGVGGRGSVSCLALAFQVPLPLDDVRQFRVPSLAVCECSNAVELR